MTQTPKPPSSLAGKRCLIVEDEFLIALDLERILESVGAGDFVSVSRAANARDALEKDGAEFDVALLDYKLEDGSSEPVAELLQQRGIPFVFITGMSAKSPASADVSKKWSHIPIVAKPFEQAKLIEVLAQVLDGGGKPQAK